MKTRLIVVVSTLFGLFALLIGSIVVSALPVGPDPARPTQAQMAARTAAADNLQAQINAARANVPPALPSVPSRMASAPAATAASGSTAITATPVALVTPRAPARAAGADGPRSGRAADDEHRSSDDEPGDERDD